MQQGYHYYLVSKETKSDKLAEDYGNWVEGVGAKGDDMYKDFVKAANDTLIKKFPDMSFTFGVYGATSSGVISHADLAANSAGMQFYKDIDAGKFKTICDYITDKFDEDKNPNEYNLKNPFLKGWTPPAAKPPAAPSTKPKGG